MASTTEVQSKVLANPAFEYETEDVIVLSGQNLKKGDIVDILLTTGNAGKVAGSDKATRTNLDWFGVLGEDCDASAGDKRSFAFKFGSLNENEVALPAGADKTITFDVKLALRKVGIRIGKFLES